MFRSILTRSAVSALAIAALTLGNAGLALAAPGASVNIEHNADFVFSVNINVFLDVNCGADTPNGSVVVNVIQSTPFGDATGSSTPIAFASDGTRQRLAITIFGGPWNVGPAVASAFLSCGGVFVAQDLGAPINIK
jgi:hypothetical protein